MMVRCLVGMRQDFAIKLHQNNHVLRKIHKRTRAWTLAMALQIPSEDEVRKHGLGSPTQHATTCEHNSIAGVEEACVLKHEMRRRNMRLHLAKLCRHQQSCSAVSLHPWLTCHDSLMMQSMKAVTRMQRLNYSFFRIPKCLGLG